MAAVAAKNFMVMDELVGRVLKELEVVVVLWCCDYDSVVLE